MKKSIIYKYSNENDLENITTILQESDLPFEDINLFKMKYILAFDYKDMIGCIGLEMYEKDGLLRSFAVKQSYRNQGIGNELIQYLMSYAKQIGIINLHLLTNTAERYFLAKGFTNANREGAPDSIKATVEFSTLCPSSSSYMVYDNIDKTALIYPSFLQLSLLDKETESKYWAISGEKSMFTYFEVGANKIFTEHTHESEQITHVLEGELFFEVNNSIYQLVKGDSIIVPSNIPHKVWTNSKNAKAIDAWSPVNNALLEF